MQNEVNFYKAEILEDLLYYLKTVNNLKVYGGGTSLYKTNKEITIITCTNDSKKRVIIKARENI